MTPDKRTQTEPPPPDQSPFLAPGLLWQLSAIAFTSWWDAMAGGWDREPRSPACDDVEHCQLVVPDALEETGEHELFA